MNPRAETAKYQAVMDRAEGRCQCTTGQPGGCGGEHRGGRERCQTPGSHRSPLMAAPVDPLTPEHTAALLSAGELMALCRACYGRRRQTAAAARDQRVAQQLSTSSPSRTKGPRDERRELPA